MFYGIIKFSRISLTSSIQLFYSTRVIVKDGADLVVGKGKKRQNSTLLRADFKNIWVLKYIIF